MKEAAIWICNNCAWHCRCDHLLRATNPFIPGATIYGCPRCKSMNDFGLACDDPGDTIAA